MTEYYNLSTYLRERYGKRLKKICIDGGFTCPNRDGRCGTGGCIFCGERGAGEHIYPKATIRGTVKKALAEAKDAELFIAYFQNFTNTYADAETLRERYDAALTDERIRILSVGTRPDCISEEVCALLAEYAREREVWVELGLQTSNDVTAERINRGYKRDVFEAAMRALNKYGLKVVVHIIIGLPGESIEDVKNTLHYLNSFDIFGLKVHSIYVMRGTRLEELYNQKLYTPPTLEEYLDAAEYVLRNIKRGVVIHRVFADCPRGLLVAPEWNTDKRGAISLLRDRLGKGADV